MLANNKKNKIITTALMSFGLFILLAMPNKAATETVCCEIQHIQNFGYTEYKDLSEADCRALNNEDPNNKVVATPKKGKIVGQAQGSSVKSCIDKIDTTTPSEPSKIIPPVLSVSIPGFGQFSQVTCDDPKAPCKIPWLAEYIKALYKYSVTIISLLAVVVMMIGGVLWLTAGGNKERISSGMNFIKGGVMGIIIALSSYAILFILNPNLVILSPININYINKLDLEELVPGGSESDYQEQPDGCPKENEIVKIEGVYCIPGRDCRARIKTVEGIKKAEEVAKKNKANLEIHSAIRDLQKQKDLWELYKHNTALVARPSCGAPHVRGVAIDVCLKGTESCNHMGGAKNAYYKDKDTDKLQAIMKEAGWIRYCGEWWHFQYAAEPAKPCSP